MTVVSRLACAVVLVALAGCARDAARPAPPPAPVTSHPAPGAAGDGPRDEPRAKYGNPPFYEVGGRRYVVLSSAVGYSERGIASWYGPDFHGGRTSTGETYDMGAMTGAHPTLPLPTWVRVTNLENGKSVVVRLNDRGPFAKGRIIDLSRAAAEQLDMIRAGTARVEVVSLAGTAPAPAAPAPPPAALAAYYAQAGAFGSRDNAEALAARLREAGIPGVTIAESAADGRPLFRVRAGPAASLSEFDALIERLRVAGAADARLAL
jgi:rare lipoprotein A